jgi:hypothetical protein
MMGPKKIPQKQRRPRNDISFAHHRHGIAQGPPYKKRWFLGYIALFLVSCWMYILLGMELHKIVQATLLQGQPEADQSSSSDSTLSSILRSPSYWTHTIFQTKKQRVVQPGCYSWQGVMSSRQVQEEELTQEPPSGLVVTLLHGDHTLPYICNFFPSQLAHFIIPQNLDVLLVLPKPNITKTRKNSTTGIVTMRALQKCLNLVPKQQKDDNDNNSKTTEETYYVYQEWDNLDGSNLTTWEHAIAGQQQNSKDGSRPTRIFLAETELKFPKYIQHNRSWLEIPIDPPSCQALTEYIQGTRWYIYEMLHLQILQEYDYFIKMDADIVFLHSIPIHLLQDMKVRGAVFGHAAQYPDHVTTPCANEIAQAAQEFAKRHQYLEVQRRQQQQQQPSFDSIHNETPTMDDEEPFEEEEEVFVKEDDDDSSSSSWNWDGQYCSASHPKLYVDSDRYYANFIIGQTDYFTSPGPLQFGKFLSDEWQNGFFRHRWGDQVYWHYALGMFTQDFESVVVDYTEFRCMPEPNCWMSSHEGKRIRGAARLCLNDGGSFLHTKDWRRFANQWNRWTALGTQNKEAERLIRPYKTKYKHDCRNSTRWKG